MKVNDILGILVLILMCSFFLYYVIHDDKLKNATQTKSIQFDEDTLTLSYQKDKSNIQRYNCIQPITENTYQCILITDE